jgi:hypothetical protein
VSNIKINEHAHGLQDYHDDHEHLAYDPEAVEKAYAQYEKDPVEQAHDRANAAMGLRYDQGKVRLDLIPPEWTWALGQVMTKGAEKYAPRNWEKGMAWTKMIGCLSRHLIRFICGEKYDRETGCHHLAHAAWNALALMSYDIRQIGQNDLVGKPEWLNEVLEHKHGAGSQN